MISIGVIVAILVVIAYDGIINGLKYERLDKLRKQAELRAKDDCS